MLRVDVQKQLGDFSVAVRFASGRGVTALFGPSGAGKTSVVNMVAGLIMPDRGQIELGGETLFDSDTGANVPVFRRHIGYVFQEGRLFPHLSVKANLEYGRWMQGLPRDPEESERLIALLDLAPLLARRPGKLSGGERQRVAIGRALFTRPRLLLLDEPLASLDARRKAEILPYLVRLRDAIGIPMIYVSHYADELRQVATSIVLMEGGRVTATGGIELIG